MTREKWKDISGYEGKYAVSNMGRVKSYDKWVKSRNNSIAFSKGRILKPHVKSNGYNEAHLESMCAKDIHRLVLETFVGQCPKNMEARHLNGDSRDNRLCNLEWSTHKDNMHDTIKHNRSTRGDRNWNSRLTAADVQEIREKKKNGISSRSLAESYGVCPQHINAIVRRKYWK